MMQPEPLIKAASASCRLRNVQILALVLSVFGISRIP